MSFDLRIATLAAVSLLSACGGGGAGTAAAVPQHSSSSWLAVLRSEPATVQLSMHGTTIPYIYVDAGASNGAYPSAAAFGADIQAANPALLSGSCSSITQMSSAVMEFTDAHGTQAPSYVIFFTPKAVGTCTQSINLGAEGASNFSVAVTP